MNQRAPGRPMPARTHGLLPFLQPETRPATHDLLVMSARPDLAPGGTDPVDNFIRRYLPEERP